MNEQEPVIRWVPLQCPSCFGLFRLNKANLGKAGHCPVCKTVLQSKLPNEAPQPVEEKGEESFLKRVRVAETLSPEEVALREERHENRKRQFREAEVGEIEWEANQEETEGGVSWLLMTGVAMLLIACLIGGGLYIREKNQVGSGDDGSQVSSLIDKDGTLSKLLSKTDEEEGLEDEKELINQHEKIDIEKLESIAKAFLDASSVDELMPYVRDSERVRPLIENFYQEGGVDLGGFRRLTSESLITARGFCSLTFQNKSYEDIALNFEVLGDNSYLVDWESYVGYCEMSFTEMQEKLPVEPVFIRCSLVKQHYYNYAFSDDSKWSNYRLDFRNPEDTLSGYVERGSELDFELSQAEGQNGLILEVAYPKKGAKREQVIISKILSDMWVLVEHENKNEDE